MPAPDTAVAHVITWGCVWLAAVVCLWTLFGGKLAARYNAWAAEREARRNLPKHWKPPRKDNDRRAA